VQAASLPASTAMTGPPPVPAVAIVPAAPVEPAAPVVPPAPVPAAAPPVPVVDLTLAVQPSEAANTAPRTSEPHVPSRRIRTVLGLSGGPQVAHTGDL